MRKGRKIYIEEDSTSEGTRLEDIYNSGIALDINLNREGVRAIFSHELMHYLEIEFEVQKLVSEIWTNRSLGLVRTGYFKGEDWEKLEAEELEKGGFVTKYCSKNDREDRAEMLGLLIGSDLYPKDNYDKGSASSYNKFGNSPLIRRKVQALKAILYLLSAGTINDFYITIMNRVNTFDDKKREFDKTKNFYVPKSYQEFESEVWKRFRNLPGFSEDMGLELLVQKILTKVEKLFRHAFLQGEVRVK